MHKVLIQIICHTGHVLVTSIHADARIDGPQAEHQALLDSQTLSILSAYLVSMFPKGSDRP